jgi:hypothetical protein
MDVGLLCLCRPFMMFERFPDSNLAIQPAPLVLIDLLADFGDMRRTITVKGEKDVTSLKFIDLLTDYRR